MSKSAAFQAIYSSCSPATSRWAGHQPFCEQPQVWAQSWSHNNLVLLPNCLKVGQKVRDSVRKLKGGVRPDSVATECLQRTMVNWEPIDVCLSLQSQLSIRTRRSALCLIKVLSCKIERAVLLTSYRMCEERSVRRAMSSCHVRTSPSLGKTCRGSSAGGSGPLESGSRGSQSESSAWWGITDITRISSKQDTQMICACSHLNQFFGNECVRHPIRTGKQHMIGPSWPEDHPQRRYV
jgi:hypothetical protein